MHCFFLILILAALLLGGSALAFLWTRFRKFEWMPEQVFWKNLFAFLPVAGLLMWWILSLDGLVVIVHLAIAWLICDGLSALFRLSRSPRYFAGYSALIFTALYLGYGHLSCIRVTETRYALHTQKTNEKLRIALISDVHLGTTFDGTGMAEHLSVIQAQKPDLLVIAGDLIDDGTERSDWKRTAKALAQFRAPLGKYFIFGNHDKGYYRRRGFPGPELVQDLEHAGVRVLRDETVHLTKDIDLTGRRDRSDRTRRTAAELLKAGDPARYRILLDHQPTDYAAESAAGADLVLSGHTHGGQLWPLGFLSRRMKNDQIYGHLHKGTTDFIVSSGISDWAITFKTGCRSEYVIIDILPEGPGK